MHLLNKHTYLGRFSDEEQELLPKARLYLLYEGSKTEELYFARLLEILKRKGLPRYLPVERCERIGKDRTSSNPKRLLEIAKEIVDGEAFSIDDGDGIALVFDADMYKNSKQEYLSLLEDCRGASVDAYVTYPSFELFLMLHVENSFERYIKPNERELIENKKEGKDDIPTGFALRLLASIQKAVVLESSQRITLLLASKKKGSIAILKKR